MLVSALEEFGVGNAVLYRLSYLCSAESTVREGVRPAKSIDASGKND